MTPTKYIILAVTIIITFAATIANSQVNRVWEKKFSGAADDKPLKVLMDNSGSLYLGGTSNNDLILIKYNSAGDTLWTRTYNGPDNNTELLKDMIMDKNGNIYLTGDTKYSDGKVKMVTLKYDGSGNRKWTHIHSSSPEYMTYPLTLQFNAKGQLALVYLGQVLNNNAISVLRIDTLTGTHSFSQSVVYTEPLEISGTAFNKNGSLAICVSRANDMSIIRFDSAFYTGEKRYNLGGIEKTLFPLADTLGNMYIGGISELTDGSCDFTLAKLNSNFDTVWTRRTDINEANGLDSLVSMSLDKSGNIILYGSYSMAPGRNARHGLAIVKYNSEGTQVAQLQISEQFDNKAAGMTLDNQDNVYIIASSRDTVTQNVDFVVKKFTPMNSTVWEARYNSLGLYPDIPASILTDNSGNTYITGASFNTTTFNDISFVKYNEVISGIEPVNNTASGYSLQQNYPNPFNPVTAITFQLPASDYVKMNVYDVSGRLVSTLVDGMQRAGSHTVTFDASKLSSGMYFYRLEAKGFTEIKKMMLVK